MAINTLETAILFEQKLDLIAIQDATTGWMDSNSGQIKYTGGAEVKIPKMSLQGLADYDREKGYTAGSITFGYETKTMTQDRGRRFTLDAMDTDETNFVVNASTVMSNFQREYITPEIDAYRISAVVSQAIAANKAGMVEYGYNPTDKNVSALRKIKTGISAVQSNGYNGSLVIQATPEFILELEIELSGRITSVDFAKGGINTKVPAIDGVPIIHTPVNRMYSAIKILDGKTGGQEVGGYEKGATAKNVNFIVCATTTPVAVTKQDKMRIFDPDTYQDANAWAIDYRRFHDLWIPDNKLDSIYVSIKDSE